MGGDMWSIRSQNWRYSEVEVYTIPVRVSFWHINLGNRCRLWGIKVMHSDKLTSVFI